MLLLHSLKTFLLIKKLKQNNYTILGKTPIVQCHTQYFKLFYSLQLDEDVEDWQRENDFLDQEGFKVISGGWTPVGFDRFNLRALWR